MGTEAKMKQDWNRCTICRARGGALNKSHEHFLCSARRALGNPTPKLIGPRFSKPQRARAIAHGVREIYKLNDAMLRRR